MQQPNRMDKASQIQKNFQQVEGSNDQAASQRNIPRNRVWIA